MTTFGQSSHSTSHFSAANHLAAPDFVSSDSAALASHMSRCANDRSRFFGFHTALESAHSLFSSRMVTCTLIAVVAIGTLGMVGMA